MRYPTVFHLLAQEFEKAKIPIILIGGFAVNYYKVSRATGDVDILMMDEHFEKASSLLSLAGYKEVVRGNVFARFKNSQPLLMDLDVLFVDKNTFSGMINEAKEVEIEGNKIKVASLHHLIALKLHSLKNNFNHREDPDLRDLVRLIQENQTAVMNDEFRELCLKYGTQELYKKVVGIVKEWKS
ncbi:MAG: nucleotidyltransferase [Candidatus Omnitrophica bacterium]|nr:nucleotidyltransferase [Candidatus Omnitrophota bacterium]